MSGIGKIDTKMTERAFLENVVFVARLHGWKCVHFGGNLRQRTWWDAAGFPDLLLVDPGRGVIQFVELKTETGVLSKRQLQWAEFLRHQDLNYHCWRPSDWPDIVQMLSHGRTTVAA